MQVNVGNSIISLVQGDITEQDTDAIVNAANSGLLGGGGVDGAIHRAGGPKILEECKAIRAKRGGCPPGEAIITTGGYLRARFVIHAVGPVWHGGDSSEDEVLRNAYRNSLRRAVENNIRTVAFPSISTGAYGFPIERASHIAFETVKQFVREYQSIREVRFVALGQIDVNVYRSLFEMDAQKP